MKKCAVILSVLCLLMGYSNAQKIDYTPVDKYVTEIKADTTLKTDDLVALIIRPFNDQHRKARAIFDWICINIYYDYEGYVLSLNNTATYPFKSPAEVLKKRTGICSEISGLAKEMFEKAGLKCEDIYGKTRTTLTSGPGSHAWNAVTVEGKWFLFDCTWGGSDKDLHKVNYFYFMTPPSFLIASHYPDDPKWTLLETYPTQTEFDQFPTIWCDYFNYSDKPFPRNREIISTGGSFSITNYVIKGFTQDIRIMDKDDNEMSFRQAPVLSPAGDTTAYSITGLPKGNFTMRISSFSSNPTQWALTALNRLMEFELLIK